MSGPADSAQTLQADALCLLAAAVWGAAFVAQRVGMEHVGPFTYNGIRFVLGSLVLFPLLRGRSLGADRGRRFVSALVAGTLLFAGASFQQIGLVSTTAGKGGFLTSLAVALVPLFGLTLGNRTGLSGWLGAGLAVSGAYLLSVTEGLSIGKGDWLVILCAVCFAWHVLAVDRLVKLVDALWLAAAQFLVCGLFSLVVALVTETIEIAGVVGGAIPILYGGVFSVGIGYTLQVVAQRHAPPAHAAILLSFESVFAALFGCWLLAEPFSPRMALGALLMFAGIVAPYVRLPTPE